MAMLSERQVAMCETSRWDCSDLRALFLNCTLKKAPELCVTTSTAALGDVSRNGRTATPDLARESVQLFLWKARASPIDFQCQVMGLVPNLEISEVSHSPGWRLIAAG